MISPSRVAGFASLALVACNAIGGIDSPVFDPCIDNPGGGCQTSSASAMGGANVGGAGTGMSGGSSTVATTAMSSSSTGPAPVCGNHMIEPPEECDDGNTNSGDRCSSDCHVECTGVGLFLDPATFHCYRLVGFGDDWPSAKSNCDGFGEHLATITSQEELDFVASHAPGMWWLGGSRSDHDAPFTWDDGEAWSFVSWKDMMGPSGDPKKECLDLDGGKFNNEDCSKKHGYICELDPPGT